MPEFNLINSMISRFKDPGFLRSNRFAMILKMNDKVRTAVGNPSYLEMNTRLSQFCSSVTVPGKTFTSIERRVAGPNRKVPYLQSYGDGNLSTTFLFSADSTEWVMFEKWQNMIINPLNRRLGYYEDYAMGCKLMVLFIPNYIKDYNQVVSAAELRSLPGFVVDEIYPSNVVVNDGNLSSEGSEYLKLKVDFTFRDMYAAHFNEMVRSGYVGLDESLFSPGGVLLDPNANIPQTETRETTAARMNALAKNGFVITPGINDMALERNRAYLDLTPKPPPFSISINQIINLAALL
jgi:hypothetical protein